MNGVPPEELIELRSHELPCGSEYLWDWFLRLNATRSNGFASGPISETELHSFFANRRLEPTAWELNVLVRMDDATQKVGDKDPAPEGEEE